MKKTLFKSTFRDIKSSKARFISIMLIVALGVGFFVGVKCTNPSMVDMALRYYNDKNLADFTLLSTVGFDKDDVKEIEKTDGVSSVMPSYYQDVQTDGNGDSKVIRLLGLPYSYENNDSLNNLDLIEGRLPEKTGEIVVEGMFFKKYKIGDEVSLSENIDDKDLKDNIKTLKYKVVGIIRSPLYISFEKGTTNVANGKIDSFAYILNDEFKFDRYINVYVRLDKSKEISPFTSEYDNLIDEYKEKFEKLSDKRIEVFKTENIDKAQKELDENKIKYEDEKEKAETELKNAKEEIDKGETTYYTEISSAKNEIENGKSEIEENEEKLIDAKKEYEENEKEFIEKFDELKKELDKNKAEFEKAYEEFEQNEKAQLLEAISSLENGIYTLSSSYLSSVISSVPTEMTDVIDSLSNILNSLTTDNAKDSLLSAKSILNQAELYSLEGVIDQAISEVDPLINTLNETKATLEYAENEFQAKKELIVLAEKEYNENKSKYQKELDDAKLQIENGESELESYKEELRNGEILLEEQEKEGLNKLNDAKTEYEKAKKEADEKLKDAKTKLDDAQKKLDDIKDIKWYINNRDENPGYSNFIDNCDRVDKVANVFPLFFLLVAMLVCLTTMTRLVEEKRVELGTFKAMGYSTFSVLLKFVIYTSIAAVLGCLLGCLICIPIMPRVIYACYHIMYDMPDINVIINTTSLFIGIVASIISCVVVTLFVSYGVLKSRPSVLMRPKAPKAGKRILLEKITFLWKRLSFSSKVTQRNLFRYKSRLFMTAIGIAGCTALIVAGFGLYDSIADIADIQFNEISKYDMTIVSNGDKDGHFDSLINEIESDERINDNLLVLQKSISVSSDKNVVNDSVFLTVPSEKEKMSDFIDLHNRRTKEHLDIIDDEAVVTEKLAKILKVNVGDYIYLDKDKDMKIKVSGISENYLYSYIYISSKSCRTVYDKDFKYNSVLLNVNDIDKYEEELSNDYLKRDDVVLASGLSSNIKSFRDIISSMKLVTIVLVVAAGALAIVVLYNLTNINLAERKREIATLKVLGFNHKETSSFVYRENIILTIIGIVFGLLLGVLLTFFIVETVEIDKVMFGRNIYFHTFLFATLFTLVFSFIVNFIMYFRIKKINMVESLKFVD